MPSCQAQKMQLSLLPQRAVSPLRQLESQSRFRGLPAPVCPLLHPLPLRGFLPMTGGEDVALQDFIPYSAQREPFDSHPTPPCSSAEISKVCFPWPLLGLVKAPGCLSLRLGGNVAFA